MGDFRAGWRAGVQDANSVANSITRDIRGGNTNSAGATVRETARRAGDAIASGAQQLGAGFFRGVASAASAVGAGDMAVQARQRASELQGASYEGQAQSNLSLAGSHFKKAWSALPRALGDTKIKGFGASLGFSVASWGTNIGKCMGSLVCAIGNGFKSLGEWFKLK
jgi:hypothetical protein